MSFTLFVQTVAEPFTEQEVLEAFGEHLSPDPNGGFRVHYDAENESTLDCTFNEDRTADSLSIDRPCADHRLFEALHRLLGIRPSFLTYPDDDYVCIVASEASAARVRDKYAEEAPELVAAIQIRSSAGALGESW